jgi:pimeloyl-ACP methyl ester carboxylesterase
MQEHSDLLAGEPIQLRPSTCFQVCYRPGQASPIVFLHDETGKDLAEHFYHSQHLHLPDARHLVIVEFPEVASAIANWITEATSGNEPRLGQ